MNYKLSREESACMKGYAMLCIMLHNLLHLVGPLVKENEFYYNYNFRAYWMWRHIIDLHENLVGDILSFFGWYGVPVFIFLSGYGLSKKYERPGQFVSWPAFLGYNFRKLWMLMAPAYVVFLLLGICYFSKEFTWEAVLAQFTLTSNFLCLPKDIDPGVYWYFGLTLQLYLVYRLFFYQKSDRSFALNLLILSVLSLLLSAWLMPDKNLKIQPDYEQFSHNCIRWLLPFFLGLAVARYGKEGKERGWEYACGFLVSLALLVACSFQQQLWLLTPLFAVGAFFCFTKLMTQCPLVSKMAVWLGGLSAWLFAVHPLVRPFFAGEIVESGQLILDMRSWLLTLAYLLITLAVAAGYRWFSTHYWSPFCERTLNKVLKSIHFQKK